MYQVVQFVTESRQVYQVFLHDTKSGNFAEDVLTVPGTYDDLTSKQDFTLKLMHLVGTIGTYRTAMYALVVKDRNDVEDVTSTLAKFLTMPDTAAQMMLRSSIDESNQDLVRDMLANIHYYESIKEGIKLCVPQSAFEGISPDQVSKLVSQRTSYVLRNTDNQEIFQKSCDSEFGIILPALEDIHSPNSDAISSLDVLRVLAPFRRQERPGIYSYNSIYHTPYFRVDRKIKGMVPSYYSWLSGYSVNDMLDIQDNERHMANNLRMLICSDISRYVAEITSGIFFDSALGSLLGRLCTKRDDEVVQQLLSDIKERNSDSASCNISYKEIDELNQAGWYQASIVHVIKKNLVFTDDFLLSLIKDRPVNRRIIECDNLPFTLQLTDTQEQEFAELLISMGYISVAMQRFLLDLCKKAYRVNWGHSGATLAIPGMVVQTQLDGVNRALSDYITDCYSDNLPEPSRYPSLYYVGSSSNDTDSMGVSGDNEDAEDDPSSLVDYYVTSDTIQKIRMGTLPFNYFSTKPSSAQTTEASIVEYWRNINGENNLDNFLSAALLKTADPSILIESFIKLSRWGERKPKLLVLQKHPEIRYVFDMGVGLRVDNTVIVDESELIKFNGCDYALEGFLCSNTNPILKPDQVIGFYLSKDYGSVKKIYLASWLDLGEMVSKGEIKIGNFAAVSKVEINSETMAFIEDFAKLDYDFYVSDSNIETGLREKVQPKDLNALALLTTPGIMDSREYLRSLKGDTIITIRDRQYDMLRRYVNAVNAFYNQKGALINKVSNTVELGGIAEAFYQMYQQQGEGKQSANAVTAASTLKVMNLGDTSSTDVIKWDATPELKGKFILISDIERVSTVVSMEFSNPQLKAVAAKANNRIVMLLLNIDGKYLFCRKDIMPDEVMLVESTDASGKKRRTVANKAYKNLSPLINNLCKGVDGTINKLPTFLHVSLKDYI